MLRRVSPEERPPAEDDALATALRVAELIGLCLYAVALWQIVSPEPTGLSRWWARTRSRAQALTDRALVGWRAHREAPYIVWEAMQVLEAGR